jgi:hypothetical protein
LLLCVYSGGSSGLASRLGVCRVLEAASLRRSPAVMDDVVRGSGAG